VPAPPRRTLSPGPCHLTLAGVSGEGMCGVWPPCLLWRPHILAVSCGMSRPSQSQSQQSQSTTMTTTLSAAAAVTAAKRGGGGESSLMWLSDQDYNASHAAQGIMDCLTGCGLPTASLSPRGRQRLILPYRRVSACHWW